MKVENDKRLSIRKVEIIFGTKCNLKCRHCMMGDPEPMAIKPEHIDALIDNVKFINKLLLTGGEATCYVDEIKMILDKLANSDVCVDHIGINTNCFEFSEELANSINDFNQKHTIKPKKAKFQYSPDRFHFEAGLTKERLEENLKKYKNILKDFIFLGNDLGNGIDIVGRAKNLQKDDINSYQEINVSVPDGVVKFTIKNNYVDQGQLILCPNGYVYSDDSIATSGISENDYSYSVGNMLEAPLIDLICQYNKKYKNNNNLAYVAFRSVYHPIFLALVELKNMAIIKRRIVESIENQDYESCKQSFHEIYNQLEVVDKYVSAVCKEQQKTKISLLLKGYRKFEGKTQKELLSGKLIGEEAFLVDIIKGMMDDYCDLILLTLQYFKNKDEETKKRIIDICNTNTRLECVSQDTIIKMFECCERFDISGYVEQYRKMLFDINEEAGRGKMCG
ncbi:MAG: radical SAM protein [Erysipelotrichia bacterium]|nr:radical SAM protein [Erysipelotrichia bacterium]